MGWIARKKLKVGDGYRYPGDPVPEADEWKRPEAYIATGYIEWVDDDEDAAPVGESGAASTPDSESGPGPGEDSPVPPRAGPGSTRDAWAEYAVTLGIEVDEDDARDDIIARVDERQE